MLEYTPEFIVKQYFKRIYPNGLPDKMSEDEALTLCNDFYLEFGSGKNKQEILAFEFTPEKYHIPKMVIPNKDKQKINFIASVLSDNNSLSLSKLNPKYLFSLCPNNSKKYNQLSSFDRVLNLIVKENDSQLLIDFYESIADFKKLAEEVYENCNYNFGFVLAKALNPDFDKDSVFCAVDKEGKTSTEYYCFAPRFN